MNLVKKILIVHGDAKLKRRLVLLLADAGYDLRSYTQGDPALETARVEWFDLALVDAYLSGQANFEFVEALKKVQPTVPVVMLVPQLELPLIVRGIRMGLSDVLPTANDLRPLLRRVNNLLKPNQQVAGDDQCLSVKEMAEAEAVLQVLGNPDIGQSIDPFNTPDFRQELLKGEKDRAQLESKVERLAHEKAALEAEIKTLLAQNADTSRVQTEFKELRTQREMAAAAQAMIDQKARALSEARSELVRERSTLEEERKRLSETTQIVSPGGKTSEELAKEKTELDALRAKLMADEMRLREESTRQQQEATQIAQERRRWHEDLDLLREQETNLREYEARLRQLQAQLEADRVLWFSARPTSRSPFQDDAAVKAAWEKLQRATDLLEAERAVFRDERMTMKEVESDIKRREAKLDETEGRLTEQEKRLRGLSMATATPFVSKNTTPPGVAPANKSLKMISRAPFEMAKSLLGRKEGA
ncbi:MAG: response regulator [Verrucomicrobia bacterium]|nr:response regulator [Verrucomicrobiota bacterium]